MPGRSMPPSLGPAEDFRHLSADWSSQHAIPFAHTRPGLQARNLEPELELLPPRMHLEILRSNERTFPVTLILGDPQSTQRFDHLLSARLIKPALDDLHRTKVPAEVLLRL